jgi:hypothetical protein
MASGGKAFALTWATREIDWTGDLGKLNFVLSSFYADQPPISVSPRKTR